MADSRKYRVTVLLSGSGTTFAAILAHQQRNPVNFEIMHVVSDNPEAYGLARAEAAGISTDVVPYRRSGNRAEFNAQLLSCIEATDPDLVVLAGFMRIVDDAFVSRFYDCLLNIHPSLLPKYPGLNTYRRALDAGEQRHGSSVHFVNNVLDGGPVIAQTTVKVEKSDDVAALSARVQEAERRLYPVVIDWFCTGRLRLDNGLAQLDGETLETPRIFDHTNLHGGLKLANATTSI